MKGDGCTGDRDNVGGNGNNGDKLRGIEGDKDDGDQSSCVKEGSDKGNVAKCRYRLHNSHRLHRVDAGRQPVLDIACIVVLYIEA